MGYISSNLVSLGKHAKRLADFIDAQGEILAALPGSDQAQTTVAQKRKELRVDFVLPDLNALIAESLEGADRVKNIVQNLKSFSRLDAAEESRVNIHDGLESTINIVWNEIKYKAELKREYGDLPMIKCFPQQLNQVFMNLLVNAAHAIEKDGEIVVRTWRQDENVMISVADNGSGIAPEHLNRLFEPFFTTKEVGKGTGLGLSIVYDIVKKHKGEIRVASEVGKGTTFTLSLPLND
jgi:two-component system NtrC family sensor kinase